MIQTIDSGVYKYAGRAAMALLTCAVLATPAHARSLNSALLVPPASLPAEAQQTGESMFLQDAADGRTLLYIRHEQGAGTAVLDVTDPSHIIGQGSVPVTADDAPARQPVFDLQGVRQQVSNAATGTTFLLTDAGLYVVRQPNIEMMQRLRQASYAN